MIVILARNGFGTVKEVRDMDLLSFGSACATLGRVFERENPEPKDTPKSAAQASPFGPNGPKTKEHRNLDFLSRVKVKSGS